MIATGAVFTRGTKPGVSEFTEEAAGVKVAYGTDSGIYPHGLNAMQLPYMVKYGMTPMQAIQSATIAAAELMQWKDSVGSVARGKYADMGALADCTAIGRSRQ